MQNQLVRLRISYPFLFPAGGWSRQRTISSPSGPAACSPDPRSCPRSQPQERHIRAGTAMQKRQRTFGGSGLNHRKCIAQRFRDRDDRTVQSTIATVERALSSATTSALPAATPMRRVWERRLYHAARDQPHDLQSHSVASSRGLFWTFRGKPTDSRVRDTGQCDATHLR